MVDFGITTYLDRVVEEYMASWYRGRDKADVQKWREKLEARKPIPRFFINYTSATETNDGMVLDYSEKTEVVLFRPTTVR